LFYALTQWFPKYGSKPKQGHVEAIQNLIVYFQRYHCLFMPVCSLWALEKRVNF